MTDRQLTKPRSERGAALLILVAVLGLGAATLLMNVFGGNGQAPRERATLAVLVQAKEALTGFAAINGRLPRPATSSRDGRENVNLCATDQACSGFLPWVTLGVAGTDSWGKLLRYSVTPVLTIAPIASNTAIATRTVRGRDAAGQLVFIAGQPACDAIRPCLPFVVFSQGRNNFGTTASGLVQANAGRGNVDEAFNNVASVDFIGRAASTDALAPGGAFDDMLAWSSLPVLYQRMKAANNLP